MGNCAALPKNSGRKPKLKLEDQKRLTELVAKTPDATLEELRDQLGVKVDPATICRALQRLDLTLKKVPPCLRAGPGGCSASAFSMA